ncbi:hypothetical protein, partial [Pectobacterium versatile]|uniref:hypothetical protein n=1 Tax=Pectobacterium versatile TaxID=2488639 RepID=UPI001F48D73C
PRRAPLVAQCKPATVSASLLFARRRMAELQRLMGTNPQRRTCKPSTSPRLMNEPPQAGSTAFPAG